ncbi:MAG: response regulator transcription factor [Ignavibacterium sp.]|jgi:DNA-binding response OmpR family regulator|nr:response regulator transcription factor [Ignavibacterium sp.]
MKRILIIEDDPAIRAGIKEAFTTEGYSVSEAETGTKGFELASNNNFDLIILDLILPGKDGIEICKDLRSDGVKTPIVMVTSRKEEIDKILGLEIGADDYVTKPFSIRELLARVKALIRRSTYEPGNIEEVAFADLNINFKKQEMLKGINPVRLSATEYRILHYFIDHESEVISRDKFLDEVWGYDSYPTTRTVDNYILSLRKKIEDDPANPKHLVTVHKVGYKFIK